MTQIIQKKDFKIAVEIIQIFGKIRIHNWMNEERQIDDNQRLC